MTPDKLSEKIIEGKKIKEHQHLVYEVVDYLYLNNYLVDNLTICKKCGYPKNPSKIPSCFEWCSCKKKKVKNGR